MGLSMVLFWVGVIALVVWLVKALARTSEGSGARDILEQRLASGEIDSTEYRDRLDALGASKHA